MTGFFNFLKEENMSLFTDFYELAMCASYFDNKKIELATFDLFIRNMPKNRSYFLFAGLEQILLFLKNSPKALAPIFDITLTSFIATGFIPCCNYYTTFCGFFKWKIKNLLKYL